MPRFPYMNFPFPFYKNYPRTPPDFHSFSSAHTGETNYNNSKSLANPSSNINSNYASAEDLNVNNENTRNFKQKNKSNINTSDYLFDLFGLKIYSDDVLLVSLIYFLYSEEVKDDSLFIVLILLLLS